MFVHTQRRAGRSESWYILVYCTSPGAKVGTLVYWPYTNFRNIPSPIGIWPYTIQDVAACCVARRRLVLAGRMNCVWLHSQPKPSHLKMNEYLEEYLSSISCTDLGIHQIQFQQQHRRCLSFRISHDVCVALHLANVAPQTWICQKQARWQDFGDE